MRVLLFAITISLSNVSFGQDATVIYKNTVNSTVTIETDNGLGSGFFVAPNIIATNYHVIEGATQASCYINNSTTKYKIDGYLAADKSVDLILLKVSTLNKPALVFTSETVSPGQKVYVIGSPKGLPATISDGIVSGMRDFEGYKLIQMTAPISPGSSGGPVLNSEGQLIGISVSQLTEGQNLNFAIPKSYLEVLLQFKKETPIAISTLYNSQDYSNNDQETNYYEKDKTYEIGIIKAGTPELSLDYLAHFGESSCFYFTYDMTNSNLKNQTIYMEDYRLVDLETGEIYYGKVTDLSSQENSRVIYKGTKSRFLVCFDRLPGNIRNFSLMEGECSESSFCFLNINLNNFNTATDVNWRLYQNNENEGTISFYTKQSIGYIDIYIGEYKFGTLTKYFSDPNFIPTCGDTGEAMLTVRLETGQYEYTAICGQKRWKGTFTITREGCSKIYFTK
jgi:hypothetical protein